MIKRVLSIVLALVLLAANALAYEELRIGSKGDAVIALQQALISRGYLSGSADGDYGKKTATAVASFQKDNGIPETGVADEATQALLLGQPSNSPDSKVQVCANCGRSITMAEGYSFCPYCGTALPLDSTESLTETVSLSIGDSVTFGHYEQDNDTSNGPEPIEWLVLDTNGVTATLISKYGLDDVPFSEDWDDTVGLWHVCDLRNWLNQDFINAAFSEAERSQLVRTSVTADKNPNYSTPPGEDSEDLVFLLSITQAKQYFTSTRDRAVLATPYAISRGVYLESDGSCWWWLRTPGYTEGAVALIDNDGSINYDGCGALSDRGAVRPVIVLQL